MCGITAFLSKNNENIIPLILKSLSIIQNRGYDSAGIAMNSGEWNIYKYASNDSVNSMDKLHENVNDKFSHIAIGHTRWATHGAKTDNNSHPHISMHKNIILVHNGIINNFQELKTKLINKGYKFYSDTDSEVIANLLEYYILENYSIILAIECLRKELSGTWALAIIYTLEPEKIFITRHGSPLILGMDDNNIICCSELSGLIGLVYNYIIIDNHDIITISKDGYHANNIYETKSINNIAIRDSPAPYEHWTIREIYDQPHTLSGAFNNGARIMNNDIILGGLNNMKNILENNKIEHLLVLGCGTSYHASMFAKYYFNNFTTIQSFDASEFNSKDIPKKGIVLSIICSQSGETRDLIKCIDICKKKKCILLGVVNVVDSLIARSVDFGVYLNAGSEIAVASTKSFTSMLIVLSLIGMWFNDKYMNIPIITTLRSLPGKVEELLSDTIFKDKCFDIINFINDKNIQSIFILGKEKMFPVSKEIALKIKEITYIHAEGYSAGSLKHGPFALLDKKTLTFLLIDENNTDSLTSTFYEINSRDTYCYIISDNDKLNITNNILILPKILHYQEIIFSIALQYLSYNLSISRDINPDKPRNLAKVVTVE
uniref:glutamine--fructose-6-phosphate transaminase (isomerizing) n=1 Tax=viral metagenome TaxID=1070528 RepID=A0A6C0AXV1_9ZZZZ|tara:strand:+ start:23 stop:1834 length:1812 start_codon:yes stop_codon:yes gene_type:complete